MAKLANDKTPARSGKGISYVIPTLLSYPAEIYEDQEEFLKIIVDLKKRKKIRRCSDGKTANT
jgi:type IV secretory pathway TraG/TraD family ATPase VirD4